MEELLTKTVGLLTALGLAATAEDPLLQYIVTGVVETICARTNQAEVPEGMSSAAVYMAAGRYLQAQKATGHLDAAGIDLEPVAKQIQEGDTSVSYAVGEGNATPEQRLDALIAWMVGCGDALYPSFRRFAW